MIETEVKFKIANRAALDELHELLAFDRPILVIDEIYGRPKTKTKIRKRIIGNEVIIEATTPIKLAKFNKKKEVKLKKIPAGYKLENSYDRLQSRANIFNCIITLDFFTIGYYLEVEGSKKNILKVLTYLGLKIKDNIPKEIDTIFCELNQPNPPLHWGWRYR